MELVLVVWGQEPVGVSVSVPPVWVPRMARE